MGPCKLILQAALPIAEASLSRRRRRPTGLGAHAQACTELTWGVFHCLHRVPQILVEPPPGPFWVGSTSRARGRERLSFCRCRSGSADRGTRLGASRFGALPLFENLKLRNSSDATCTCLSTLAGLLPGHNPPLFGCCHLPRDSAVPASSACRPRPPWRSRKPPPSCSRCCPIGRRTGHPLHGRTSTWLRWRFGAG